MTDVEDSADGLRIMIRSLKNMRDNHGKPPRNYAALQILLDKIEAVAKPKIAEPAAAEPTDSDTDESESSDEDWGVGWGGKELYLFDFCVGEII